MIVGPTILNAVQFNIQVSREGGREGGKMSRAQNTERAHIQLTHSTPSLPLSLPPSLPTGQLPHGRTTPSRGALTLDEAPPLLLQPFLLLFLHPLLLLLLLRLQKRSPSQPPPPPPPTTIQTLLFLLLILWCRSPAKTQTTLHPRRPQQRRWPRPRRAGGREGGRRGREGGRRRRRGRGVVITSDVVAGVGAGAAEEGGLDWREGGREGGRECRLDISRIQMNQRKWIDLNKK